MTLTRAKFNEMTASLVEATMGPVRQALSDSGLSKDDIDKVLLVGGSTRIPAVQEAIKDFMGKEPFKGINPDECVAMGAAIQAGVLAGDVKGLLLLDVTPLSLGVETLGGIMTKIIERNTTIPTKKSQIFSTAADNQPSVEIHVLQGEREFAKDNKTLGRFHLDGIPPAPRGVPQIEVTFDIDANGIVNVSAKDLATGREQKVTITSSTNMSKEDIERAVKEGQQYAEEDKKRRENVEIRNTADQMVYQSEKIIREMGDKMESADKDELNAKLEALREALKVRISRISETKQQELTNKFHEVSAKVYNSASRRITPPHRIRVPPMSLPATSIMTGSKVIGFRIDRSAISGGFINQRAVLHILEGMERAWFLMAESKRDYYKVLSGLQRRFGRRNKSIPAAGEKYHPDLNRAIKRPRQGSKRGKRGLKYCPTARKEPVMTSSAMRGLTRISVAGIRRGFGFDGFDFDLGDIFSTFLAAPAAGPTATRHDAAVMWSVGRDPLRKRREAAKTGERRGDFNLRRVRRKQPQRALTPKPALDATGPDSSIASSAPFGVIQTRDHLPAVPRHRYYD